ncbi:MAG: iron chaperone [Anaerolineae bacterium]
MQYEVKTPAEYMSALEDDWRRVKLEEIRGIIKSKAPDITEGINYKMLSYGEEDNIVFHLNAQKNYVSFYVGDTAKIDPTGELLEGINCGKGCLRFKKTLAISDTRLDEFIGKTLELWRAGEDVSC